MDLKFRFQPKEDNGAARNQNTFGGFSQKMNSQAARPSGLTGGLNRYKKKVEVGKPPADQFKRYMLDGNNVFYQNRPSGKRIEELKSYRWCLLSLWIILVISYLFIGRIRAYEGVCPQNAKCGVFIHCSEFFEYDGASNTCVLSSDIIDEIKYIAESQILQLQYNWGDSQCSEKEELPSLNINTLFDDLEDYSKKKYYQKEARLFFSDEVKQKELGFAISGHLVQPTQKMYSLSCRISKFCSDPRHILDVMYFLVIAIGVWLIARWFFHRRKIQQMYNFLKDRVLSSPEQTLNVTNTLGELALTFGDVNQVTWQKINDVRDRNREIGYFEGDFLYWKKI